MTSLIQYLGYATSFACFLFAAHLLVIRPANRTPSLLLAALFFVFAAQPALLSILLETGRPSIPAVARPSLAMTIGPLMLLYFVSAADPAFRLRWRNALHLLPAVFIAFEMTSYNYWIDIDLAIIASFAAYSIAVWLRVLRGVTQFAHLGAGGRDAFRMLLAGAVLLSVSLIGEIIIVLDFLRNGALSNSVPLAIALVFDLAVIGVAILAAMQRPSPFDWIYQFGAALKGGNASSMSDAECESCIRSFEALVEKNSLFREEGLGLNAMAKRLGAPARRLSEAINRIYGESYSRRMNRWRVEEAKRLLRNHPGSTITDVMFDAGFRTKSSFNREFRMIEGVSPTEYRNSIAPGPTSPDALNIKI